VFLLKFRRFIDLDQLPGTIWSKPINPRDGRGFRSLVNPVVCCQTNFQGRSMHSEIQSDHLLAIIFVLGSMCIMRVIYMGIPGN
jgi:hypothetical protein